MLLITQEMKEFIHHQKLGFVATVSPNSTPNLSPKGTIIVWNEDHLVFADIKSPNTISNIRQNPFVEINVVDPITRKGYRFKGNAIIISEGQEFEKIIASYKSEGVKSKINCVVSVKVEETAEITSPLYDLGFTEEEIKERWKKHYLSF